MKTSLHSNRVLIALAALAGAMVLATGATADVIVLNGDFESPELSVTGQWYTATAGALPSIWGGWTFATSGASSGNGIVRGAGGVDSPDFPHLPPGNMQAAFVEGPGTFSQIVSGFVAGTASVSFAGEGRNPNLAGTLIGPNSVQVTLDGVPLLFGGVNSVTPAYGALQSFTSDLFAVTAGAHTLAFTGLLPFNGTPTYPMTVIDNISIANGTIPEPTTLGLLGLGLLGLMRRRK